MSVLEIEHGSVLLTTEPTLYHFILILLFYVYECSAACMSVLQCIQCPQRLEEGITSQGNRVSDACKPPSGYWELNLSHLEEQSVL